MIHEQSATSAVRTCSHADEYVRLVSRWEPTAPFPVLLGPQLDDYLTLLESLGLRPPAPHVTQASGTVLSTGSEFVRAAAALLARTTGRPHRHVSSGELLDAAVQGPTAIVGLVTDLNAAAAQVVRSNRPVGLLAARTESALSTLIYRTATVESLPPSAPYVVSAMTLPGAEKADAVAVEDLVELRERYVSTLVLRIHGRECSVILPDGVLCGRSDGDAPEPFGLPLAETGKRVTSCMRGGGCHHIFNTEEGRVPARDIRASFVLSQSCTTVSLGTNAFPNEVGVALGFLDGTTVGLIGPVGKHIDTHAVRETYERCTAEGWPLGDLLVRLNELGNELTGEHVEFALLGDPALRMPATSHSTAPVSETFAVQPELTELNRKVLPALERLRWLEFDVDTESSELRREIRKLSRRALRWGPDSVSSQVEHLLRTRLPEAEHRITARLLETVHQTWWKFESGALPGLEVLRKTVVECPECGRGDAVDLVLRHRVEPDLILATTQCPVCGDLFWSTDESRVLTMSGPLVHVARSGTRLTVRRTLVNHTDRPLRGGLGFAFCDGQRSEWPRLPARTLDLSPGGRAEVEFAVPLPESGPVRDEHPAVVVVIVDGHCSVSPVVLSLD